MAENDRDLDAELGAIQTVVKTLEALTEDQRSRVLDYVFRRLGLTLPNPFEERLTWPTAATPSVGESDLLPRSEPRDVRSLKEEKDPKSAVEMAAIVAYYLAELAPADERKETVATADLQKYFKQAKYPLPKALRVTLATAAASGYMEAVSRGQYRLTPVGYNLVAHGLPSGKTPRSASRSAPKKGSSAKSKRKAKSPRPATGS
jgi:hypothetical protein